MTEESPDYTLAIESAGPSARGGFEFRMRPGIDLAKHLTQSVRSVLDGHGAENYVEMRFADGERDEYIATFRRRSGKTPDELRQQAEAERDRLRVELAEEQRQRAAVDNQVSALAREVQRLQHAEMRARRHALERDRDVAEADAQVAAKDAEVARLNAREARTQVELHDARYDVESLTSRLKATSDACNDALNKLHTKTEVARGNKRHAATLTVLLERVTALTLDDDGQPKDPALVLHVGDLRRAIDAPIPTQTAEE